LTGRLVLENYLITLKPGQQLDRRARIAELRKRFLRRAFVSPDTFVKALRSNPGEPPAPVPEFQK
jgi:hypothetical protein